MGRRSRAEAFRIGQLVAQYRKTLAASAVWLGLIFRKVQCHYSALD